MSLICDIARKNRIGITLIEIFNLLINRKIKLNHSSIYKVCDTLQRFKIINKDIFFLAHKYSKTLGI